MGIFGKEKITGADIGKTLANNFLENYEKNKVQIYENYDFSKKPDIESVFLFLLIIECYSILLSHASEKINAKITSESLQNIRAIALLEILRKQNVIKLKGNKLDVMYDFIINVLGVMTDITKEYWDDSFSFRRYLMLTCEIEKACKINSKDSTTNPINSTFLATLITGKCIGWVEMYSKIIKDYDIEH